MKFKVDFVTNSSSSSFVVMGIHFDLTDLPVIIFKKVKSEFVDIDPDFSRENLCKYKDDVASIILEGSELKYSSGQGDFYSGDTELMIGIPYTDMKENETLKEFKERIKSKLKERLGSTAEPHHIEACWEDR